MIYQTLRKEGDHFVVTIPAEEVERQHLEEGQWVAIEVRPANDSAMREDVRQAFEASWKRNAEGYLYLKDR
jgi:antitoxin component of MazEF toxin-antitoxin module